MPAMHRIQNVCIWLTCNTCSEIFYKTDITVFFKCLGSLPIHKEIKLQEGMDGIENIFCKTDLNHIQRLTYKCNIFNGVHFEACFKFAYVPLWYSQFR